MAVNTCRPLLGYCYGGEGKQEARWLEFALRIVFAQTSREQPPTFERST
jgi:hypothetical protein